MDFEFDLDLGKYELLEKIRKGSFNKVYTVKENATGRILAALTQIEELSENDDQKAN